MTIDKRGDVSSHEIKGSKWMSKDLSRKLPMNSSLSLVVGGQYAPESGVYPVADIIAMVKKVREDMGKEQDDDFKKAS